MKCLILCEHVNWIWKEDTTAAKMANFFEIV